MTRRPLITLQLVLALVWATQSHGLEPIAISSGALKISVDEWRVNDIEKYDQGLIIAGPDPYIQSGSLHLSTEDLAGFYFELDVPAGPQQYQFFYATDRHGYQARDSFTFKVSANDDGRSRFYIPMDFLTRKSPVQYVITGLRIDFDRLHGDESAQAGTRELRLVLAIPKELETEYSGLLPNHIIQQNSQRSGKKRFALDIVSKLLKDKGFFLCYLTLLVLCIIVFMRAIRRGKKHAN